MNKLVVAFVALAVCAFADTFEPKAFDCSGHMRMEMTVSDKDASFTIQGDMYYLWKGEEVFVRNDINMLVYNTTTILRCDQKKDGKCLMVSSGMGQCKEDYEEVDIVYNSVLYYDKKEDGGDCPDGGKCTKYCNSTENACYWVDSDKRIVKTDDGDGDITVIHYTEDPVSADLFAVDKCDKTKLPAPTNPCAASITKAALMVVLVALLVALF